MPRGETPAPLRPEGRSPLTRSGRERLRLPLMWGVPLLMVAAGLYVYFTGGRYQSTDDAYPRPVRGPRGPASPKLRHSHMVASRPITARPGGAAWSRFAGR